MPISWPREQVLGACRTYAGIVTPIDGVDSMLLLGALAANESSVGVNCGPRYEPGWDLGSTYAKNPVQAALLAQYGSKAAMSYGPLQIMFYNAPGFTPDELNTDLTMVMRASIAFLNKEIRQFKPQTVTDIGQIWNHGSIVRPPNIPASGVQMYCKELESNYTAANTWF